MMVLLATGCTKIVTKKEYVYLTTPVHRVHILDVPEAPILKPVIIDGYICFTPSQFEDLKKHTIYMRRHAMEQRDLNESYNIYIDEYNAKGNEN